MRFQREVMADNGTDTLLLEDGFRVGEWLVQPGSNRISNGRASAKVEPRVMEVLVCLARKPGKTISREDLLDTLWADAHVTEDALNRSISKLRKAFDDDPREPAFIETIPKVGYRLIAPVSYPQSDATIIPSESGYQDSAKVLSSPSTASASERSKSIQLIAFILAIAIAAVSLWFLWLRNESSNPAMEFSPARITPLTSYSGREIFPSFSPDGNQIAFAWKGFSDDNWDIYVKQIETEAPLRLTDDPAIDIKPSWSPDGRTIAFVRISKGESAICMMTAMGKQPRKLMTCGAESEPDIAWSPDGEWLAYTDRSSPQTPYSIFLFSSASGEKRQITSPPAQNTGDSEIAFSPDGRALAFVRSTALGVEDIYLMPSAGGEARRLTFDNLKIHGLAWEAEGERIIFSSNRGGGFSLWHVPVSGGSPEWLAPGGQSAESPSVSMQGNLLAYEQWSYETNIRQMNLSDVEGDSSAPLISSTKWDESPQFSPDGNRIAFISDRSGAAEVWVCNRDGSNPVRLTSFNGPYTRSPRWSPDGRRIAFDNPARGNFDIYIVSVESGLSRRLTDEASEDRSANWSKNGRWLYFASNRSGSWQVWKMSADGGEATQMTESGGLTCMESPDGEWLYYTKPDVAGLWRVSVRGGEEIKVLDRLEPVDWNNWLVDRKGIYFIDRAVPDEPHLVYFDLSERHSRRIVAIPKLLYKSGLSLSPDGKTLLYTRVDKSEADLILVKNFR